MRIALYAGSFDPLTLGHIDIVERGLALFDEVVVSIGHNPNKARLLPLDTRLAIAREAFEHSARVRIDHFEGLTIHHAQKLGAVALLRGLRDATDLAFEAPMAAANRRMAPELDTVFLPTDPKYSFVSSSLMREIAAAGGDPSAWLPSASWRALRERLGR